jgi:hypothetical protein
MFCFFVILALASLVNAQSDLSLDERIALVEKKIEGGAVRGDLTKTEYSRLKPRLAVVKHKRAKIEKDGATHQAYKDLDHYLYGLERDTDRLLNSLKRR